MLTSDVYELFVLVQSGLLVLLVMSHVWMLYSCLANHELLILAGPQGPTSGSWSRLLFLYTAAVGRDLP